MVHQTINDGLAVYWPFTTPPIILVFIIVLDIVAATFGDRS